LEDIEERNRFDYFLWRNKGLWKLDPEEVVVIGVKGRK